MGLMPLLALGKMALVHLEDLVLMLALLVLFLQLIGTVLVDVETATAARRETTALVALQEAATASAERANGISEAQFRAGTIDLITLLNTQITLFNARNQLAQARLQRLQAAVGLFRALGGGWS